MNLVIYVAAVVVAAFLTFGIFADLPQVWMYVLAILNLILVLAGSVVGYRGNTPVV